MEIGIVTGASSGIGKEFALQVEDAYALDEVWLIAKRENLLEKTAAKLNHTKAVCIPMNLTSGEDMDMLKKKIEDESPGIRLLVNSAGYGHIGAFQDTSVCDQLAMIDLNVNALVRLTHICLPQMGQGSVIFQVASINAFMPIPNGAIYCATKAFVLNFAHAIHQELKTKGIHVITVSPGAVDTEWLGIASNGAMEVSQNAAQPSDVVSLAIKDAKKGKLNSTYGLINKGNIFLSRLLTRRSFLRLLSK